MRKLLSSLESLTNSLTMYMVTVYALLAIVLVSLLLSAVGELGFPVLALLATLLTVLASTYLSSRLCAWTFGTQHNRASGLITSLILYLTLAPGDTAVELFKIALIGCIASVSKYLLVWRGRHIFNPAALALALGSFLGLSSALWWVGTPLLLPVVLITGLIIVTKTRRYAMVTTFTVVAIVTSIAVAASTSYPVLDALRLDILSGPLAFFAAVMLTEPLTSPATRRHQIGYAGLVGLLYSAQLPWVSTPHISLLVGNLYRLIVQPQRSALSLRVISVSEIAPGVYELQAMPAHAIRYTAGQYLELQVPHAKQDSRGTRRIFSIASSPDEKTLRLTTRVPTHKASSFKHAFVRLTPDTQLRATYIGGDFVLPHDPKAPLLWVAGGIGITPFRAMAASLLSAHDMRPVILFYQAYTPRDLAYLSFFTRAARSLSLTIIPVVAEAPANWTGETGRVSRTLLGRYVPDIHMHHVYISGAPAMVESTRSLFAHDYKPVQIMTDHFSGY
ncbi:hypothetical protein GII36_03915 [Candidatus Mycosynbacter amalyticus]|uniref:FAD-binding FR-type domain-containing protein n=1 Tax=Candidatus Mycosynbacter amalyticus TaxID=2665156 RepID=A0A857MN29_9BACT|nr:hypothetical protein [Candidatus Mycosynbacter amalyticus]QHN42982.1 hypothetical protein GII36_03915 [Candidatus Mycosynbacter amalyticus]